MGLKAKKPEVVKTEKPKMLVFGGPGVGKTWASLDFPQAYYIDTEGGATQPHYRAKMQKAGVVYFGKDEGSQDFQALITEVKSLATEKHQFKTLIIDSFSKLYNLARAKAEATGGSDYGRDKKEANKPTRQLMYWIEKLDMNVLLICHTVPKWERAEGQLYTNGNTFDGWEKLEYDLSLSLEITFNEKEGKRVAKVKKTRLEGFPYGEAFTWSYDEFSKRAGEKTMLREVEQFKVGAPERVARVKALLEAVKVDADWEQKALDKHNVETWDEMEAGTLEKAIAFLESKLPNSAEKKEAK